MFPGVASIFGALLGGIVGALGSSTIYDKIFGESNTELSKEAEKKFPFMLFIEACKELNLDINNININILILCRRNFLIK